MNKYKNLNEEEMLGICYIINSSASWHFNQLLDNDGNGTDDCYEFLSNQEDIIQFNIHQSSDDEIRCYLGGDIDNDEVPFEKIKLIDDFLIRNYYISDDGSKKQGPYIFKVLKRKNIRKNTLIWHDGLENWTEAKYINELNGIFDKSDYSKSTSVKNKSQINDTLDLKSSKNLEKSKHSWIACLCICYLFGLFGGHRFYTGNIKSGIIQLLTFGCFGVWTLIDFILILSGKFKNSEGQYITR
mgnify:FL=1